MAETNSYIVYLLGYPAVGKRAVGTALAERLDGVLVDNQLINMPILALLRWDGKFLLPPGTLQRADPIREAVLRTIEEIAPPSMSYIFTNVLEDTPEGIEQYNRIRAVSQRRGSTFLAVMLTCDIDVQVSRIDSPDRRARFKGSDPEGYRHYTLTTKLFVPPADELLTLDTTVATPYQTAEAITTRLRARFT